MRRGEDAGGAGSVEEDVATKDRVEIWVKGYIIDFGQLYLLH